MVIFPASMDLPAGQTFTIGMFTWTTGMDGVVGVMEAVRFPATKGGGSTTLI
jgi:hypothetical protein